MKSIYCISGLGADQRIFSRLHIAGYDLVPVSWIKPEKDESLPAYALRLLAQIPEKAPIIIGLSLGGMMATEIARRLPDATVILVSSARLSTQLGFNLPVIKWIAGKNLIPQPTGRSSGMLFRLVGASSKEELELLKAMSDDIDPGFKKWAVKAILSWTSKEPPPNTFQIHGTADRVLLSRISKPDVWVQGGSHFMIFDKADEVSAVISRYLAR